MLIQFAVENFRSIKNSATLDMCAVLGRGIKEHKDSLIDGRVLPVSAIYGPNGGGKTTLLLAFRAMQSIITRMWEYYDGGIIGRFLPIAQVLPFQFDSDSKNKPTHFEVVVELSKVQYKYGLLVKKDVIVKEYLYKKDNDTSEEDILFERENQKVTIECEQIKGTITEKMASQVSPNMPLLVFVAQYYNESPISDIVGWFRKSLFINYNEEYQEQFLLDYILQNDKDEKLKRELLDMLNAFDVKLNNYEIKKTTRQINIQNNIFNQQEIVLTTLHQIDDIEYKLPFQFESMGTRKVVGLIPWVINSLKNGTTLFVDELDAKLHPKLLEQIIRLYTDKDTNIGGGQIIFTTHDMTTMRKDIFRRDEIYFVALTQEQASELYSLIEIKEDDGKTTRKDGNFAKRYLEGRYGADPYFGIISKWGT